MKLKFPSTIKKYVVNHFIQRSHDVNHSSQLLTHGGGVTHICVCKLTIIGSDNGLVPGLHPTIIWTNAGIFIIQPVGINFSEILSKFYTSSFKEMHLKMSSGKQWPFCFGLNGLSCNYMYHQTSSMLTFHYCKETSTYWPSLTKLCNLDIGNLQKFKWQCPCWPTLRVQKSKLVNTGAYRKVSNIRHTNSQNLNDSRLVLELSVPNSLKPSVKSIMKM